MNKTPSAWMLRRDGIAFPCQWHYYGNADPAEVEETLYAAEWLYDVTQSEETRRRCLDLIAAYGVALRSNRNLVRNLLLAIRERPGTYVSEARAWGSLPYDLLSLGLYYTGSYRLAGEAVDQALRLEPENPRLLENRRFIYARLGPEPPEQENAPP